MGEIIPLRFFWCEFTLISSLFDLDAETETARLRHRDSLVRTSHPKLLCEASGGIRMAVRAVARSALFLGRTTYAALPAATR